MEFVFGNKTILGDRRIGTNIKDIDVCILSILDNDSIDGNLLVSIEFTPNTAEDLYNLFCYFNSTNKPFSYDLPLTSTVNKYTISCYMIDDENVSFNIIKKSFGSMEEITTSFSCDIDSFSYFADVWFWYYLF